MKREPFHLYLPGAIKRQASRLFFFGLLFLSLSLSYSAKATSDTTIATSVSFATLDAADGTADGVFTVNGKLTIACGGSITCNDPSAAAGACPITIVVNGDLEMLAGSSIYAENRIGTGNGGDIKITVTGKFTMWGPSAAPCTTGAIISSSTLTATSGNMNAGDDTIHVTGNIDIKTGAIVKANSYKGKGGDIEITGGNLVDVDGSVLSQSSGGGSGTNQGHGGRITIISKCTLEISDTGVVSSKGFDPGADLVHLEACIVKVYGLVESTGVGHALPYSPPNHLDGTFRPDKDPNSTGGIEIWGDVITIDNTGTHNAEIKADLTAGAGNRAWIDIFARHDINLLGSTTGLFLIHSNVGGNNGKGGTITVKSVSGAINASGLDIQANGVGSGNRQGGVVTIHAKNDLNLVGAKIEAKGVDHGGKIDLRSFGTAPSTGSINMDATTNLNVSNAGQVTETACGTVGAATVVGSVPVPVAVHACGGNPLLPLEIVSGDGLSYVKFPVCTTGGGNNNTCRLCSGPDVVVDVNTTINFNTATPTCSGDADLCALFSYIKDPAKTANNWVAVFNLGGRKLVVKPGVTITTSSVGGYAPGITINTTCDVQVDLGGHIVVNSFNKDAGDININAGGHIIVNGEVRNEVSGTLGLPGAITAVSKCGDISVGNLGIVQILGIDPGANTITLLTCGRGGGSDPGPCETREIGNSPLVLSGNITIDGLVKAFAHAHVPPLSEHRPNIRVVSLNGTVTINSNANGGEPQYDEFSIGGGKYDLFGGLLSMVSNNVTPGSIWVQAKGDITVYGHGDDATAPVRKSFGALAAVALASDGPGGLIDVRSLQGNISGSDRAFDVSGNHTYVGVHPDSIVLYAMGDISLTRPGNSTCNPVVDAHGINGKGGTNEIRSYSGSVTIGVNALVSATGAIAGVNNVTYCTSLTNNGTINPAAVTAATCLTAAPSPSTNPKFDYASLVTLCNGSIVTDDVRSSITRDLHTKTILLSSYPNPFNHSTNISYSLSTAERVDLRIYNMEGKEVANLANGLSQPAGDYVVPWNASAMPEGVYIVRLQAGNYVGASKIVLAR